MSAVVKPWFLVPLLLLTISGIGVVLGEWCIANEQIPDSQLQMGLDWACGRGGANCSKIQVGGACFGPNTIRAHACYAFNNYYQKFKHRGATCHFNGAAIITDLDPSHNSCNYEFSP